MKVKIYILGILLLNVLLFNNCKKDVEKTNSSTNIVESCINTENTDTIFTNKFYTASERTKDGGLVIIEEVGDLYSVVKVNSNGNFEWKNDYPEILGEYSGITTTDDAIYITSNIDFNNYSYYDTIYTGISGYFYTNAIVNCEPVYDFTDTNMYIPQNNVDGITYLTKIDLNGNLIFSKQFEGNTINNNKNKGFIQSLNNNELILFSFDYYGSVPYDVIIDTVNNRIDTVKYTIDNNTIHIYKLNSSGNILWQKEIDSVQTPIFTPGKYPIGLSNFYISANNSVIVVNLYSYIIILDNEGNLVSTVNEDKKCEYKIYYTLLLDDYLLFSQNNLYDYFTTKTDLNGNILDENFQIEIYNCKQFEGNSFIGYNSSEDIVFVSDVDNNIIKQKQIENELLLKNVLPACDNSFFTIKWDYIDDGSTTGGTNYYYIINKEVFE